MVAGRVLMVESSSAPQDGEVVVFAEHFARGIGLPTSHFFFCFLTHYGLQPHHLAANAALQLVAFVTLCEGFLVIEPACISGAASSSSSSRRWRTRPPA
ncbi:retrotransposon ty3-gypsy subclass [Hordeum vulgare]|nr:retrotransposon ty3-gypsy subclass [Hordeum vulgare]